MKLDDSDLFPPPTIPDLISEHFVINYYDYKVELDWFQCEQDDDWWGDDEPHFHILSHQPLLEFEGDGCLWNVYYNVLRTPVLGSQETFGYTVTQDARVQQRSYQPKFEGHTRKIKICVTALNTEAVPWVYLSTHLASGGNNLGADREFYIDLIPGAEYTLSITNLTNGLFYGYGTLEEVAADTSEEEEQIEDYLPDYLVDCYGDPTRRCQ